MRSPQHVVLDVEGVLFKTSLSTLTSIRGSLLAQMVAGGDWKKQLDQQGHVFIDRDSRTFPVILAFHRDGSSIPLPHDEWMLARIAHEAKHFRLPELEKLATRKRSSLMEPGRVPKATAPKAMEEPAPPSDSVVCYEPPVKIPIKKSTLTRKESKRRSFLSHLSISLPRNFAHLAHVGWKGAELHLSAADRATSEDPSMQAIERAAKEAPASQVYNMVDGDSARYGSAGVEIVLGSSEMRPLPQRKPLIPPFRPLPPIAGEE